MLRIISFLFFVLLNSYLFAQKSIVPLEFSFNQSMRFDDIVLIEIVYNDTSVIYHTNTRKLEAPFIFTTLYLSKQGRYCLNTVIKTMDFKESIERQYCFDVNGNEEKMRLDFSCVWDTISYHPLNVYRKNKIKVEKRVADNPAGLVVKRLWKTPFPDKEHLRLPYEIYNPSDKLLYSEKENGVAFQLEQLDSYGRWQYLNCGSVMRLGKPFKPKQSFKILKNAFVDGCDKAYLKGNTSNLRLNVEYHFGKAKEAKVEKIQDKKSIYVFNVYENYSLFDEFSIE